MTDVERMLREVMRAHDHEAPTVAQFRFRPPPDAETPRHRATAVISVAASVCVVAVILSAMFLAPRRTHSPTPRTAPTPPQTAMPLAACPPSRDLSVSTSYRVPQPATGFDVGGRLVPLMTPSRAIICAYLHQNHGALTGTRAITENLAGLRDELSWLPPNAPEKAPCTSIHLTTDGDAFLIGFSYPGARVWVSVPGNHCLGASNGRFEVQNLGAEVDTAFRTGAWKPVARSVRSGCPVSAGRLGQQNQLVPGTPISVEICRAGLTTRTATADSATMSQLARALNALTTASFMYVLHCGHSGTPAAVDALTFGYAVGPPVQVNVYEGCRPAIDNGSLQAQDANSVLPLVHRVLGIS